LENENCCENEPRIDLATKRKTKKMYRTPLIILLNNAEMQALLDIVGARME
jgi:hypothetical protein